MPLQIGHAPKGSPCGHVPTLALLVCTAVNDIKNPLHLFRGPKEIIATHPICAWNVFPLSVPAFTAAAAAGDVHSISSLCRNRKIRK
jgi:hypothetical protein